MQKDGIPWPAVVIQGVILGNISLILAGEPELINSYFILAAVVILILFFLQSLHKRFLFLFPIYVDNNKQVVKPTPSIDTYILRILFSIFLFFFLLGLVKISYRAPD